MARKDYYTVTETSDDFVVTKMDVDSRTPKTENNDQGTPNSYKIAKAGGAAGICDCFAGFKFCRHKQMVIEFQKTNRVGQRWLYNFDKKIWIEPFKTEEM